MAGLLSDVLPFLYSQGDRAKRYVGGLLSDPLGSLEQTGGGLLDAHRAQQGLLAQAFSNQARPFQVTDRQAMGQAAQNMLNGPLGVAPAGITAWHGSPHVFDKFDSSKIGTGEGAQAYGHGLYLAENPEVARQYRDKLSDPVTKRIDPDSFDPQEIATAFYRRLGKRGAAMHAESMSTKASNDAERIAYAKAAEIIRTGDPYSGASPGSLYKVDLPDEAVAKMLDWDKPLSQSTPSAQELAAKVFAHEPRYNPNYTRGMELWQEMNRGNGPVASPEASKRLREAGIPGIRYLDGGSRGAGQGTANYVVFPGEENILSILERNGVPLR
jgi:hypothetical protein